MAHVYVTEDVADELFAVRAGEMDAFFEVELVL